MKINIIQIANNNSIPKKDLDFVKKTITKHAKVAVFLLPFKIQNITFTVYAWDKNGNSGFTQAIDWISININYNQLIKKNGVINKELLDNLIYIVYHEMHHACRGYAGLLPKNKEHILINSIISEGLADHYANEQYPCKYIKEHTNYDLQEVEKWIKRVGKVMRNKESDDDSWLYGGKGKPKLLGYKIGRYIIQNIKNNDQKLNSINLTKTSPEKIIKLSKISW